MKVTCRSAILRITLPVACRFIAAAAVSAALGGCNSGNSNPWQLGLSQSGARPWSEQWFLEGEQAEVVMSEHGFVFSAGPSPLDHAGHAVLWSKDSFSGDLRVEYDYTRLDSMFDETSVNILYLQASGLGTADSPTDIRQSTTSRRVPLMRSYFLNMNLLHVSYSTTGPQLADYVSARQYPAASVDTFNESTLLPPIYEDVGLFAPGDTYHITVIKQSDQLEFVAERDGIRWSFQWSLAGEKELSSGRVGFRHMWARSSKYENILIFTRNTRQ